MNVGFEVIAAGTGLEEGQGGASGYIEGLVPEVLDDPRVERLVTYVPEWYRPAASWAHGKLVVRRLSVPRARPARVAVEQIEVPSLARRDRIDVLFSTGNYRPLAYRSPNVVALHAVQHFLLGDDIGRVRSAYLKFAVPRSVRTADLVVAVTETLRRDAIELFDLPADRIVSVPMGPSPWVLELMSAGRDGVQAHRLPDGAPYVLAISRLYALKNHRRLIQAFAQVVRGHSLPHRLVIVGGDADVTREQLAAIARGERIADRVDLLGRVPQTDLPGLYAGADAVAYVSLYETFGHPVLEAFAMERPLVASRTGGTAEVAADGARLVDPEDVGDIATGLHDTLTDEKLRERLVAGGRARVRQFSWQSCARGTVDALGEALRWRRAA
jgi:glycosyltransferase involved in cell wall biosynthesis